MSLISAPCLVTIREQFGLHHQLQVLEVETPDAQCVALRDISSGQLFPVQHSKVHPSRAFLLLELQPFQTLELEPVDEVVHVNHLVQIHRQPGSAVLSNGLFSLHVPVGTWADGGGATIVPGPVERFQIEGDDWRGNTFLETRARVSNREGWLEEEGPLRSVFIYRVEMEDGGFYRCRITVDAGQIMAAFEEEWEMGASDQVVWDFTGADFPQQLLLLDSSPAYTTRKIQPHFDQRHARLWCWTQQTQLHDLSDGFALKFGADVEAPVAGFVTLNGGQWGGNRLNHLEAWTRRWWREDPFTRRGQNWESKADSLPGSDAIPARGRSIAGAHFNLEGWLAYSGSRQFGLVLAREKDICSAGQLADGDFRPDEKHFEGVANRDQYAHEQSVLRRLHIQRGLFPLSEILQIEVSQEAGAVDFRTGRLGYLSPIAEEHLRKQAGPSIAERKRWMFDYLGARMFGFWESSGLAYTNPVSSRDIAPALLLFEYLAAEGHLSEEEESTGRAQLLFLASLFYSRNCYPGEATMQPIGAADGVEPTLAGMANQNFFTDVFNTYGLAAQVFPDHPMAATWSGAFGEFWRQQLEFHTYPESGLWEESHTYYLHVLHTVLPTCLRRRDDGVANDFLNPRFQRMVRAALLQITPPDALVSDCRHLVAFGDHYADVKTYAYLFRELAEAFVTEEADLAGQLGWLYREMHGKEPLSQSPRPVEWRSGPVQGLGYFFRTTSADGTQNLLALRSGGAWAHHHHDEGSIQFFAFGRALIVDAACGYVPLDYQQKFVASGHSRWSLANEAPFNFYWRFNRGEIIDSGESPQPYAVAHDPVVMTAHGNTPLPLTEPVTHQRRITQLAPTAFLIEDTCDVDVPQVTRFHLPVTEFKIVGSTLHAIYPAVRESPAVTLYISNLNGQSPVLGKVNVPDRPGLNLRHLATQEVVFPCEARSAVVISAQAPGSKWTVDSKFVRGEDWELALPS